MSKIQTLLLLFGALVTVSCGAGPDRSAPALDHVRVVVLPYLTHTPFYIADEERYFEEQGLDVEFLRLGRNQDIMSALAYGDVDVAAGMLTLNELGLSASGARVRMVAALGVAAPGGCTLLGFVARRELAESGALEDPARLRTLRFDVQTVLPFGYFLDQVLQPYGLTSADLQIVDVPPPAAVESLRTGVIDVSADSEPFLSYHAAAGASVVWKGVEEIVPGYVTSVMMYGPGLLDERPDVGRRFMLAMVKAARRFREGKTARNIDTVVRSTGLEREQVETMCWPSPPEDGRIDPAVFRGFQKWALDRGLLARVLADEELFDQRFVDFANAELAR